ncbi:ras GEF [Microthyrium microscopicum]|uniref:Ras GEF n=1 Tax=Microthyrium microscopicum TaxID=703497 RepID=A0A6A6UBS5_9PEZI|nr:ras GEF [Microthyrium microscopicum]
MARPRGQSGRAEHSSKPSAIDTSVTNAHRPPLKSRALSAPLVPKGTLPSPLQERGNGFGPVAATNPGDVVDEEIANDPFFQRYSLPHNGDDSDEDDEAPSSEGRIDSVLSPTSSTASLLRPESTTGEPLLSPSSPRSPRYWNSSQSTKPQLQAVNIAVVGASQVGKSTFIRQALDWEDLPDTPFTQRKVQMDGTVYVVRLIEIGFGDLDLDDEKCICWPDVIRNTPVPHIDGAFTLYDVTCKDSLIQVPETLNGLYNAKIPFLLVACKCDHSPNLTPVNPDQVDADARAQIGSIRTLRTSEAAPDTQKRCVAVLLRAIAAVRSQQLNSAPNRRRANSSAIHSQNTPVSPPLQKHHRANSEMSMNMYRGTQRTNNSSRFRPEINPPLSTRSQSHQNLPANAGSRTYGDGTRQHDFVSNGDDLEMNPKSPGIASPLQGDSFEDLVTRLLSPLRLKADTQFASVFLALYRLFASPGQLLDTIIKSFDALNSNSIPQMIKAAAQQRHLSVLEIWTSNYPGDFAHPYSSMKLQSFVTRIANSPLFIAASQELAANLEYISEDDDTDWAFCDRDRSNVPINKGSLNLITKNLSGMNLASMADKSASQTPVSPTTIGNSSMSSSQSHLSFVEQAIRQATHLTPTPRFPLNKLQWHLLMDAPEDVIANEMSRMDWTMFCSIRPRDLVRHVSLSGAAKANCRALENVERMIDHFNHVALWTVNMILLRDKPKHRALMLEKLMRVARELRRMNNYNGAGAVVAGINNVAIQRLHSTKELINPAIGKDFLKLNILMAPEKSHSAYRLAWENTSGPRIPYLPIHRRDLIHAAESNRTFIGEEDDSKIGQTVNYRERRINWKKFEIMGAVVVSMAKAKDAPNPGVSRNDEIKSLLIDVEIERDDEKLWERSRLVEPSPSDSKTRSFPWPKR